MWAWSHAGVYLPHSSAAQYASLPHVAQSDLQPGDLVFFYSPISHVGMYVGGGSMIHSPHHRQRRLGGAHLLGQLRRRRPPGLIACNALGLSETNQRLSCLAPRQGPTALEGYPRTGEGTDA